MSTSTPHEPAVAARPSAPDHPLEIERLAALCALRFDPDASNPLFDRIALRAATLADAPIGLLNLVRGDDQATVGRFGLAPGPVARQESVCAHTIVNGAPLVVPDLSRDPRFATFASVADDSGLRFYAGVSVRDGAGLPLGSLCVADPRPRTISRETLAALERLATVAGTALRVRRLVLDLLGPGATPLAAANAHEALTEALAPLLALVDAPSP